MHTRLADFVHVVEQVLSAQRPESELMELVVPAMARLIARDDWLPQSMARPDARYYRQYLLHRDASARFSVVSFVWGPAQATPVHDHLTWGVIGMLRGGEFTQRFSRGPSGQLVQGTEERLLAGDVACVSPRIGDIHRVRNAFDDQVSISIHAYGADIGAQKRHVFEPGSEAVKEFVSGYSNEEAPT